MAKREKQGILDAIRALNPEIEVTIAPGITVFVRPVRVRDISKFIEAISKILPEVLASSARKAVFSGQKVDPTAISGELITLLGRDLFTLISECTSPEGVFEELDQEMAAPIVAAWVDLNILNPGKFEAWKKAFQTLEPSLKSLLPKPTSGSHSKN